MSGQNVCLTSQLSLLGEQLLLRFFRLFALPLLLMEIEGRDQPFDLLGAGNRPSTFSE